MVDHNDLIRIGERLRQARVQRDLEVADAAARLKLDPKYLRALEWERFDLLPSPGEAREYLRSYAELLGLDAELGVEQVDSKSREEQTHQPARRDRRRVVVVSLLAGCALAAAGVGAAWQIFRDGSEDTRTRARLSPVPEDATLAAAEPVAPTSAPPPGARGPKRNEAAAPTRLAVAAVRGDSWVEARSGSVDGALLYRGNLERGRSIRLSGRRLWLRLGAASNLELTLNGRKTGQSLFGTVDVTFGG